MQCDLLISAFLNFARLKRVSSVVLVAPLAGLAASAKATRTVDSSPLERESK